MNIDLPVTILDIAGVNLSTVSMDGQSFLPQMVSEMTHKSIESVALKDLISHTLTQVSYVYVLREGSVIA